MVKQKLSNSLSLSSLCVIYPRGFSLSTKNYKTYVVLSFIHCGILQKFFFLTQNFSLWWAGDGFSFSLSQSFFSLLCNLPQRKVVSTQLQNSKRVTTGPNGLQRVTTGPVPTGSNGFDGGGEERSMTRLLSPHNNIIYIIYLKKFYFYSYLFSLCNNPRKYL
jgi:hypothetical protein